MAKLKKEHKVLIVSSLAENATPTEVQDLLRKHFGLDVSLGQISYYNPEIGSSTQLSKDWRTLYFQKKEAYRKELSTHPTTNKAFRIGLLEKGVMKHMRAGEYILMAKLLDQIAKEMGGHYDENDGAEGGGEGESYTSIQVFMQEINKKIDASVDLDSGINVSTE